MRRTALWLLALAMASVMPAAAASDGPARLSYDGKTALVTGSTDGLGRELALALAADGAHVIVHGRNAERGAAVVQEIADAGKGSAEFVAADLASMASVRDFADTIAREHPKLDLLVNNAGVAFNDDEPARVTADGHELQFAVNYLAGWVLANKLRLNLKAAAPSRIINVASLSASAIEFDDVMLAKPGAATRGYGQSKLAQVSMTVELAPAFAADGITMISLHPATLMPTTMVKGIGIPPRSTIAEGRDHVMGLIHAPTLEAGAFYVEGKPGSTRDPQPEDPEARKRLVAISGELTGVALD